MCLARLFLKTKEDKPLFEGVTRLEIQDSWTEIETLSGETKIITGKVVEVDFLTSSIIVEPAGG